MPDWESIFDDEEDDPREEGNDSEDVDAAEDDDLPEDADDADAAEDDDLQEDAGEDAPDCPSCGSGMVRKASRYGDFWSCRRFPECRGARNIASDEDGEDTYEDADKDAPDCPDCGSGMVRRTARQGPGAGNDFWGCSNYPNCRGTRNIPSAPEVADDSPDCPDCGSGMVRRKARQGPNAGNDFWGCSHYPECLGTRDMPSVPEEDDGEEAETPSDDHKIVSEAEQDESIVVEQLKTPTLPPEPIAEEKQVRIDVGGDGGYAGDDGPEPIAEEKQVRIGHNQKGVSFDKLLDPYLKGATEITVTDPYIYLFHQMLNFMEFLATVAKHKTPEEQVSVKLVTKKDKRDERKGDQQEKEFEKMQEDCRALGIDFTWEYKDVHDRHIKIGQAWMITLGRGLDIFQRYEMQDARDFAHLRQKIHRCRECEVTFISQENVANF